MHEERGTLPRRGYRSRVGVVGTPEMASIGRAVLNRPVLVAWELDGVAGRREYESGVWWAAGIQGEIERSWRKWTIGDRA